MVSRKTVSRISRYRRVLTALRDDGTEYVYSHELARHAAVTAAQVRRDLMVIGYSGSPNKGYGVSACLTSMGRFLDGPRRHGIALVGVGNLGRAILAHATRAESSAAFFVAFDVDPAIAGTTVNGCRCLDAARMEEIVRDLGIEIAMLTVPKGAAQSAAEALIRAGVKSIITFAPDPLHLPDDVFVEYIDISATLESAVFFSRIGGGGGTDDDDAVAIEPIIRTLESLLARSQMKLEDMAQDIGARVVTPGKPGGTEITRVYAGDRVSDLLNEASDSTLLVSNLASLQMLRVAELMDVPGICFVNGIDPEADVVELARENGTFLLVSPVGVFETCGLIYQHLSRAEQRV